MLRAAAWLAAAVLAVVAFREMAIWVTTGASPAPVALPSADVEGVLFDPGRNPPWLVFAASALLLLARLGDLRAAVGPPGSLGAAALAILPAVALLGWAHFVGAPDLMVPALVLAALGVAHAAGGARLARMMAPPLLILLFAMPLPGVVVNRVVFPFQLWTADYAARLLELIRLPHVHLADTLRTASNRFIVIEGCSGLGSMEVLTILTVAYAWFTRAPLLRGLLLVVAAPLIAFGLNGIRVVLLVLDPHSNLWSVHTTQGLVVFAVGALSIALLDAALSAWGPGRKATSPPGGAPAAARSAPHGPLVPLVPLAVTAALAAASLAIPRYVLPRPGLSPPLAPDSVPGFEQVGERHLDRQFLGSVGFTREVYRAYRPEGGGEEIWLLLGEDDRRMRFRSLWSDKNRVPGSGWAIERTREVAIPGRFRTEGVTAHGEQLRTLTLSTYWNLEGFWSEVAREWLGLDQSPLRREAPALLLQVHTEIAGGRGAERDAERRLRDFLVALNAHLATLTHGQVRRM